MLGMVDVLIKPVLGRQRQKNPCASCPGSLSYLGFQAVRERLRGGQPF